ncbi:MAG: hypothetical protein RDV48_10040 [Candidatus Eremiobacteraeota bacterium]|nr:hypothetical protein [Candidatus Eremiobacteraeota bacterium]
MELVKILVGFLGALFVGFGISLFERAREVAGVSREYFRLAVESVINLNDRKERRVRVKGTVKPSASLLAGPFTGKECVYCKYRVLTRRSFLPSTQTVEGKEETVFMVEDPTGAVLVEPFGGRFIIRHDTLSEDDLSADSAARLRDLMEKKAMRKGSSLTIIEEHLEPEEPVTVLGTYCPSAGDGRGSIGLSRKSPLIVVRCSDEAFALLHRRAWSRLLLLGLCFLAAGLFNLYLLFFFR